MAETIASGDWWTLDETGALDIRCVGDMPDYRAAYGSPPPWYDCRAQITSAAIGDGATSVGGSAFYGCSVLTSVAIPDGVTSIGDYAFCGCSALAGVTIPGGVKSIGDYAFDGCSALAGVAIPDGATSIGEAAFRGCGALSSVAIPDSVTSVGGQIFRECGALTGVAMPGGVTSVKFASFYASGLRTAAIPRRVAGIGNSAFYNCRSLTSVTIPGGVKSIGKYAFDGCGSLADVYYGGTEERWGAIDIGDCNAPLRYAAIHCEPQSVALESVAITTPPAKTAYVAGETFDPSGMIVTAAYDDGTAAAVTGYSISPQTALTAADATVTVSYSEGGVTATATAAIAVAGDAPVAARQIIYNGQSKPIIRLVEAVNALTAALNVTDAQIEQAVADAYDAAFQEGGEQDGNGG